MRPDALVFLDTSVLIASVISSTGGARETLRLGEARVLRLCTGSRCLQEMDGLLARKAPHLRPSMVLLLDRSRVQVGPSPSAEHLVRASAVVSYSPDAYVLAEALASGCEYMVSLDRRPLVGNTCGSSLPFPIGTPGDLLLWVRTVLRPGYNHGSS